MFRELSWRALEPKLIFDDGTKSITSGEDISLRLSDVRHCVGYWQFDSSGFVSCPSSKTLPAGKNYQCEHCRQTDASFAAKTGYGLSEQATKLLESDHVVYLAYFADQTIKVGVALWERREVRVSEQGAIACLFIARGNGTVARNLERRIHNTTGFTEWLRLETKLKALFENEPKEHQAKQSLEAAFEQAKDLAPSSIFLEEPSFIYLYPRYKIPAEIFETKILLVNDTTPGASIFGKVTGILGKAILISAGEETLVISSDLLAGFKFIDAKTIKTEGVTAGELKINRQQNLFSLLR